MRLIKAFQLRRLIFSAESPSTQKRWDALPPLLSCCCASGACLRSRRCSLPAVFGAARRILVLHHGSYSRSHLPFLICGWQCARSPTPPPRHRPRPAPRHPPYAARIRAPHRALPPHPTSRVLPHYALPPRPSLAGPRRFPCVRLPQMRWGML